MKSFIFLLIAIALFGAARGNYLVTTMYSDSATCGGDKVARIFVTHGAD